MMKSVIVCPACGREYMPAEIFIPKYLLDEPTKIIRDATGKILDFDGIKANLSDTYICECGKQFDVTAKISFEVKESDKYNMREDYSYTLGNKFVLSEF